MRSISNETSGGMPFPYGPSTSDEELRAAVLNSLHWHSGVPQNRIKVVVENGRVTLVGAVEEGFERDLAEAATMKTAGVTEVQNSIEVRKDSQGTRAK
jgi:osmotically-inducible protein OsmY